MSREKFAAGQSLGLTRSQIDSFRTAGIARVPNFFPAEVARGLRELSDKLSTRAASILNASRAERTSLSQRAKAYPTELIVVPEACSATRVCRYEFMMGSDPDFAEFIRTNVQPAIAELVAESVLPFKDKTNEKLPGGGAFGPHQDIAAYYSFQPRYHTTALLTIDPANITNGCLQFATNFYETTAANPTFVVGEIGDRPLLHYNQGGPNHGDIRSDIAMELRWQPFPTTPLDLVVFDSFIPHFSNANLSAKPRRAIFVTYNRASEGSWYERYYAEKRTHYDDPKFHVSTPTSCRDKSEAPSDYNLNPDQY